MYFLYLAQGPGTHPILSITKDQTGIGDHLKISEEMLKIDIEKEF